MKNRTNKELSEILTALKRNEIEITLKSKTQKINPDASKINNVFLPVLLFILILVL